MPVPLGEKMRSITRRPITRAIETQTPRSEGFGGVDVAVWAQHTDPIGNNAYVAISSAILNLRP